MGNRLLDWQYRYLWSDTRSPYFAAIRLLGNWAPGTKAGAGGGGWDPVGLSQQVFAIADRMREIGGDTYHRDFGWWPRNGDWIGPDWKQTADYLTKSNMRQLIYMFLYDAESTSSIWSTGWFDDFPAEIGLIDLGIPAAEQWMKDLLVAKAQAWGDYEWRKRQPVHPLRQRWISHQRSSPAGTGSGVQPHRPLLPRPAAEHRYPACQRRRTRDQLGLRRALLTNQLPTTSGASTSTRSTTRPTSSRSTS